MLERTFAIGDIHGDLRALDSLLGKLPELRSSDTLVFVGDYIDRGPDSKGVIERVRSLEKTCPAKVVALRGNHEDAWVKVADEGWPEFVMPRTNGCLEALRSFTGGPVPSSDDIPDDKELIALLRASFFPADVLDWMRALPYFYENNHAIFVHAGLVKKVGGARSAGGELSPPNKADGFLHPSEVEPKRALLWVRDKAFFEEYDGKTVVFGHTTTEQLPAELSSHTPADPKDLWAGPCAIGLDTGAGKGGFLSAIELPWGRVYESR
ncbi:MAG: metallophosphoesterase family protein [Polyangiaceae bacterium]